MVIKKRKRKNKKFKEVEIWKVTIGILKGLQVLHSHNIIHRDIKPANTFIMKDGTIKLGDFNISKIFESGVNVANTQKGTPVYAA